MDLHAVLDRIEPADETWRATARARLEQLVMPTWALGETMDLALDLAGITRSMTPPLARKAVYVFAGDHGVARAGVSPFPQEVTPQMIRNFVAGGAGINAFANNAGARVEVVDMGTTGDCSDLVAAGKVLDRSQGPGTDPIHQGPAMARATAEACLLAGAEVALDAAETTDLFATGDMGIGNTTPSAAILACLTGMPVEQAVGRGAGADDAVLAKKRAVVADALRINQPDPADGVEVLATIGGFEIGGIAGLILGAAAAKRPVLVDGFISTAGALIAATISPSAKDYMIAAHCSAEAAHVRMLEHLGKTPLLKLGLRLGEGTGAALAMPLVTASARLLTEVATFAEAAVSEKNG